MKFISFSINNQLSFGVVDQEQVIDLGARLPQTSLISVLNDGSWKHLQDLALKYEADYALSDVQFQKPLLDAGRFICIGRNYRGHLAEANMKMPDFPSMFIRLESSVVAHQQNIILPKVSNHFDFEGELAVVIGKEGRHISHQDALSHIAGYSIFMDGSIGTGSFGPYFVSADEVGDPSSLQLHTRLNGVEVQHTKTNDLIFDIPYLIEYISSYTPLLPGDIIATGTPEGVGFARNPPLWMKAGDRLEVEISHLGILKNFVVAEI